MREGLNLLLRLLMSPRLVTPPRSMRPSPIGSSLYGGLFLGIEMMIRVIEKVLESNGWSEKFKAGGANLVDTQASGLSEIARRLIDYLLLSKII